MIFTKESLWFFQNEVDEDCDICSSNGIMQPLFYAESLNVK